MGVQVICDLLAVDGHHDTEVLSILGTSAALTLSDIPWNGPIGAVRVGLIGDQLCINPTQREVSAANWCPAIIPLPSYSTPPHILLPLYSTPSHILLPSPHTPPLIFHPSPHTPPLPLSSYLHTSPLPHLLPSTSSPPPFPHTPPPFLIPPPLYFLSSPASLNTVL